MFYLFCEYQEPPAKKHLLAVSMQTNHKRTKSNKMTTNEKKKNTPTQPLCLGVCLDDRLQYPLRRSFCQRQGLDSYTHGSIMTALVKSDPAWLEGPGNHGVGMRSTVPDPLSASAAVKDGPRGGGNLLSGLDTYLGGATIGFWETRYS